MKRTDGGGYNIVGGQLKPNYSVSTITSPPIVDRGHISAISKGKFFSRKRKGSVFPSVHIPRMSQVWIYVNKWQKLQKTHWSSLQEKKNGSMYLNDVKSIMKNSLQQPITGNYRRKSCVIYNNEYKYACVCGATFNNTRNLHRHHSNQGGCEYANNFTLSKCQCKRIGNNNPQLIVTMIQENNKSIIK